jgi:putative transposase
MARRGTFSWRSGYSTNSGRRRGRAAMNMISNAAKQKCGGRLNNRPENSHQPFRRQEGAMARFRDIKTLQKLASVHASIHNHFNHQRHLNPRSVFKQYRSGALAEWRRLGVA